MHYSQMEDAGGTEDNDKTIESIVDASSGNESSQCATVSLAEAPNRQTREVLDVTSEGRPKCADDDGSVNRNSGEILRHPNDSAGNGLQLEMSTQGSAASGTRALVERGARRRDLWLKACGAWDRVYSVCLCQTAKQQIEQEQREETAQRWVGSAGQQYAENAWSEMDKNIAIEVYKRFLFDEDACYKKCDP